MVGSAKRKDNLAALPLVAPFVVAYLALFVYPSLQMLAMSLPDSQLTKAGEWVGLENYAGCFRTENSAPPSSTPSISPP